MKANTPTKKNNLRGSGGEKDRENLVQKKTTVFLSCVPPKKRRKSGQSRLVKPAEQPK